MAGRVKKRKSGKKPGARGRRRATVRSRPELRAATGSRGRVPGGDLRAVAEARGRLGEVAVVISQFEGDLATMFDVKGLLDRVKADPLVGLVRLQTYPSSRTEIAEAATAIAKRGLARIVVAGCSERLYGKLYRERFEAAGIDPSLVGFANIIEHCRPPSKTLRAVSYTHLTLPTN